ncbi:MAG: ATP-binding protein [Acidimicrobiia bacterium]|nr:ATP-binding protein [Acidimicrobiia bacterium]
MTKVFTARAELILAREDMWPLREVPLQPDPLSPFAFAFAELRDDLGDHAEVIMDLVPVTRGEVARRRRQAVKRLGRGGRTVSRMGRGGSSAPRSGRGAASVFDALGLPAPGGLASSNSAGSAGPARAEGVARLDELDRERTLAKALRVTDPHFQLQLLIRTRSEIRGRPQRLLQSFLSCFEEFGGENYLRVKGRRILGRYLGSDAPWNRLMFDRRVDRGIFRPSKKSQMVSATQIGGLVKPATVHCAATNVVRSGGVVPPPPRNLPTFNGSPNQMPWGTVTYDDAERLVSVALDETFFTWTGGRTRFGKTETSLCRFVHVARSGHGALFLDPHADALARVKPYLVDQADRVIELSIARGSGSGRQVGWNPFSMEGLDREDLEDKMAAIVDSFAAAMGWVSDRAPRALTLTQAATRSLLELAYQLPDDLAPTIFQMTTLLSDEEWRAAVVPKLSPALQSFWENRFPRLGDEAITPVTNVIDRMQGSPSIAALLGSSRSTYNLRKAMDDGAIVLVRLRGTGQIDQLMASFVVYDLLRAVLSRWDTPPLSRRPLHAFMDEVQSYDHSVKGLLASALEEGGKFGLRLHLMNQQPTRLAKQTLDAVLTNRSHLMSTNLGYESARLLAKEWQGHVTPETIQELEKYQFITQVTWRGQTTTPFRARGLSLEEMFGPGVTDEAALEGFEQAIDHNSGRRPIRETLDELATLDDRIRDHIEGVARLDARRGKPAASGGRPYRSDRVRQYGHSGGMGPDHEKGSPT